MKIQSKKVFKKIIQIIGRALKYLFSKTQDVPVGFYIKQQRTRDIFRFYSQ